MIPKKKTTIGEFNFSLVIVIGRYRWVRVICVYVYTYAIDDNSMMDCVVYVYMRCWCCYHVVIVEFMFLFSILGWWSWRWADLREGFIVIEVWLCLVWHMKCRKQLELAKRWVDFNGQNSIIFKGFPIWICPSKRCHNIAKFDTQIRLDVFYNFHVLAKI